MVNNELMNRFNIGLKVSMFGALLVATGCASMFDGSSNRNPKKKKENWSWFKKPEYQEPKSMVTIWSEDTLIQPGKPVTRGFGGRIYFYNEKSQPIPVEGELMVYGFDDSTTAVPSASPSDQEIVQGGKKFGFTAEQFTQHFSHSDLGASYSIWIPWDAASGEQKKITLMPTFITKDKRVVRGDASKLTLSGKTTAQANNQRPNNAIQLASAVIPTAQEGALTMLSQGASSNNASSKSSPGLGMTTTTIRMDQPINRGGSFAMAAQPTSSPQAIAERMLAAMPQLQSTPSIPVGQASFGTSTASSQANLPPLGHNIPTTGWVQPGQALSAPTASTGGFQPHQFPSQGQPAWK